MSPKVEKYVLVMLFVVIAACMIFIAVVFGQTLGREAECQRTPCNIGMRAVFVAGRCYCGTEVE